MKTLRSHLSLRSEYLRYKNVPLLFPIRYCLSVTRVDSCSTSLVVILLLHPVPFSLTLIQSIKRQSLYNQFYSEKLCHCKDISELSSFLHPVPFLTLFSPGSCPFLISSLGLRLHTDHTSPLSFFGNTDLVSLVPLVTSQILK